MSSKYTTSGSESWHLQGDRPRLSDHALERYDERMPAGAVAPETAWEHGQDVPESILSWFTSSDKYQPPERVRVYGDRADGEWYVAVLIVRERPGPTVVTCYRVETIHQPWRRAYLHCFAGDRDV